MVIRVDATTRIHMSIPVVSIACHDVIGCVVVRTHQEMQRIGAGTSVVV